MEFNQEKQKINGKRGLKNIHSEQKHSKGMLYIQIYQLLLL